MQIYELSSVIIQLWELRLNPFGLRGLTVIDLGCGNHRLGLWLHRLYWLCKTKIINIDFRFSHFSDNQDNCIKIVGCMQWIPISSGAADIIIFVDTLPGAWEWAMQLNHSNDPEVVISNVNTGELEKQIRLILRECSRVLKNGGVIVTNHRYRGDINPTFDNFFSTLLKVVSESEFHELSPCWKGGRFTIEKNSMS